MSSKQPRTASPLQSTRQMLDELDSLMERMLALPVGDAEELPSLPREGRRPVVAATLTIEEPELEKLVEDEPAIEEPKLFPEREAAPLWEPPAPRTTVEAAEPPSLPVRERVDAPAPIQEPHFDKESFDDELPPPIPITRPIQIVTSPADEDEPRAGMGPVYLWPLLLVNHTFDGCTLLLGPLGRGLRGSHGRMLLGIVGIICLGLAGAWAALEQFGWPR